MLAELTEACVLALPSRAVGTYLRFRPREANFAWPGERAAGTLGFASRWLYRPFERQEYYSNHLKVTLQFHW
jgi:hypothetical protein